MTINFNWFILALIGAIGFGINIVLFKVIMNRGLPPLFTTTYLFTFTTILLWVYILTTQKITFPTDPVILTFLIVTSLIAVAANLVAFTSFKLVSNPGYSQAVTSLSVLVAVILSIFAFKLKADALGITGSLFVIIGLFLLARMG